MTKILLILLLISACAFPRPADVKNEAVSIGGLVHGLWTGNDGIALRLESDDIDMLYSVTSNGAFTFSPALKEGESYVVSVVSNPTMHTCAVTAGGKGVVGSRDITSIDVACVGPSVSVTTSAPQPWTFDASIEIQATISGSLFLEAISITVGNPSGLVTSAEVAHVPSTVNEPSPPQELGLGMSTIDVEIRAVGGLSNLYKIVVDRGSKTVEQYMYGKASNTGIEDRFGTLAVFGDLMAVGAPFESSSAFGVNGGQTNDSAKASGAVYVFRRVGSKWMQEAYIKASNTDAGDTFGTSLTLYGDFLAVGAPGEDSSASGINGGQISNDAPDSGAVYVFQHAGNVWLQQAYIKASNTAQFDRFGASVSMSGDTLAVGASGQAGAGAAYVFRRVGTNWSQQAFLQPSNPGICRLFGYSLAISGDILGVGAPAESSNATGVDGDQSNNAAMNAGAVYVFQRTGNAWLQQAYVKASNADAYDSFGWSVAVSGESLAVGAYTESSNATGIDGDQANNGAQYSGAVYVFARIGAVWVQQAYVKASNTDSHDNFGISLALNKDVLVVGASGEYSRATGVNGDQSSNETPAAGAVYVFQRSSEMWSQQFYLKASNTRPDIFRGDAFGWSVALSDDTLVASAVLETSSSTGIDGNQSDTGAADSGAVYVFR